MVPFEHLTFSLFKGNEMKEDQFFDYSEWDDTICSSDGLGDGNSTIVESPKLKKPSDASQRQPGESSPPTSQLMKKFFPKLDAKEKVVLIQLKFRFQCSSL